MFDAALGLAAAGDALPATTTPQPASPGILDSPEAPDPADLALLTSQREEMLLPTLVTEDTVYGPDTRHAPRLLTAPARLTGTHLDAMLTTPITPDDQRWQAARREAVDAVAGS